MGTEIERKYLVNGDAWREGAQGVVYRQGYLTTDPDRTVRVRVAGDEGYLTIKGRAVEATRAEFEYRIPTEEAGEMLDRLCLRPLIEKIRYRIAHGGRMWDLDEFLGENEGLILAEIELGDPDEAIDLPAWAGQEVTDDSRYYNANLIANPFRRW